MLNSRGKNLTVLVDSWAWIEYFKGSEAGKKAKQIIESGQQILVSTINIGEVYLFLLRHDQKQADHFIQFMLQTSFIIPLETTTALNAATLKNKLKMGMADAIVLASAEDHKADILTGDDDFKNMKNVIYLGR